MDEKQAKTIKEVQDMQAKLDPKVVEVIRQATRISLSKYSVVVFKDTPWIYVQFWISVHLGKPTILICRNKDKYFAKRLKHPMLKHVLYINEYGEENSEKVASVLSKIMKK